MTNALARTATLAVLAALASGRAAGAGEIAYPPAPRGDVVDRYFGTDVADPYRRLEDIGHPETAAWVEAEERLARDYLAALPDRDAIAARLATLWNYRRTDTPWREAGKIYFTENSGLEPQPVYYCADSPGAQPRVVLDPREISPDGAIAVRDFAVSPDGRRLAYLRAPGGADVGEVVVRDLDTGREGDVVRGVFTAVCWTYDGNGFFYFVRPQSTGPGGMDTAARIDKRMYYHRLGDAQSQDPLLGEWPEAPWLYAMTSDDGRRAIIVEEHGRGSSMFVIDLGDAMAPRVTAPLTPLLGEVEAYHTPMGTVGDVLYAFTDLDAPRGCVIALDLGDGASARPRVVIPEAEDVVQRATVAGDLLAVHYLHDVKSRLALFRLDGTPAGEVALPGVGAMGWALNGRHSAPELWYSFNTFLSPETVYRYDTATGRSEPFRAPRVPFDPGAYETRQVFYASKDGTRVPMFITARRDLPRDASAPVFLTAYGGYGAVMSPSYRADLPMWLEAGGVYAVANLRGGGEYGEAWHRAGSLERKQNSFDDFIAAAEYLVKERYTVPEKIAIYGHSNGGLLVGAMITQRPDLFAVALANAGHHDMLRYQKFTVGAGWIPEYGSSDREAEFRYLYAYSPLHRVRAGTCYPATILLTGDHDDRVVPGHSYKFAAALQAAQGCDRPVLLRVAGDASHSYASGAGAMAELTDVWAFVGARLNVRLGGDSQPTGGRAYRR